LDICHGPRLEHEQQLVLYMVFEHVDQDLASYLERCPSPGLGAERIKVRSIFYLSLSHFYFTLEITFCVGRTHVSNLDWKFGFLCLWLMDVHHTLDWM
jgi:hypothetical protein